MAERSRPPRRVVISFCLGMMLMLASSSFALAAGGILQMRNGYFWDPAAQQYFVPRGIAYQIWNPPVGASQSFDQVEYDLIEFKKMYANSVRCEFVWSQLEIKPGQYDWSKPDYLVAKAHELGIKLFVIIGFQYPPPWFPKEWRGINDRYLTSNVESNYVSEVLNYEHPEARRVYRQHIERVTARYKDSAAVGAWILGNEYAYFDLWEEPAKYPSRRFVGYDPISQGNFRKYLSSIYGGKIAALNANWGAAYPNFESVVMPARFPSDHHHPGYHDLIQWRKTSIGDFIALGAQAARSSDPNHLTTYSMVGGIFNGNDANNTAEDGKAIVARCAAAGVPLDFWSINSYAWASFGSELRSVDFGIGKYQAQTGLPVMISETGHSSTEDLLGKGAAERQPKAVPSTVWESLLSGAIGVHIFHWNDRSQFTQGYFLRERGFGIVHQDRTVKQPVYGNVLAMFRQMENVKLDHLLGGSLNPPPDIQFFWSTNAEMVWPRANQENAMLWGALKRVGYQPTIIDDQQFEQGAYAKAKALLLSRGTQMDPRHLDMILNDVLPAGVHVHANVDLPGEFDAYNRRNPNWAARMNSIFGLNVTGAMVAFETSPTNPKDGNPEYRPVQLRGTSPLGSINLSYRESIDSWKIWHGIRAASGTTVVTHTGLNNSQPAIPALQIKNIGPTRTALNTFAIGDTFGSPPDHLWDIRYDLLRAIYRDHFGITPIIDLSGPNNSYKYVIPDYRICSNGSILISLMNEHTNRATVTLSAPSLLLGKTVENLSTGGIVQANSSGSVTLTLSGDDHVLLYAYQGGAGPAVSLVNPNPQKLWFVSAPTVVWPRTTAYAVSLGYDTPDPALNLFASFERVQSQAYAQSANRVVVTGRGTNAVEMKIPDADANDPDYMSSRDGGEYVFRAWLERGGVRVSEAFLPVRLVWGVHPANSLPTNLTPGQTYSVPLEWQELPSYQSGDSTPLSRAALWDSLRASAQHYNIVLELRSGGQVVASDTFLTRVGSGSRAFTVKVPTNASGPFTWSAHTQTSPNVQTRDVEESFEGRDRGAVYDTQTGTVTNFNFIAPWTSFTYVFPDNGVGPWQNEGVHLEGSHGSQSAFLVMTNPPNRIVSTFGVIYAFTNDWALPTDPKLWSNYVFSYDYKEKNSHKCVLEMQIKNLNQTPEGKWIQFSKPYVPGSNGWDTVRASLDQFVRPPNLFGVFEPDKVHALIVNILMISSNVQFVASIDNIRFDGPDTVLPGGEISSIYSSSNDFFGLRIQKAAPSGTITISWPGTAVLQSADTAIGPWSDVPRVVSPSTITPSEKQKFYRLRQ